MILVAGHICLDIIPRFESPTQIEPGKLIEVGAADITTGGCVANVGRALHRLGVETKLVGKIGDDAFGSLIRDVLQREDPHLATGLVVNPTGTTSYSIVISPPGIDRTFLHMPGENDTFTAADLDEASLKEAEIVHFGYPSLMAKMFADEGAEFIRVLQRIRQSGAKTSVDLSLPDPNSPSGSAPWREILKKALPLVDFFFPGTDELDFMLGKNLPADHLKECLSLGAQTVVIKMGSLGLLSGTVSETNSHPCFQANVVGTTGAGDATIAGFLMGVHNGFDLQQCLQAACAVGASSVEAADACSAIPDWTSLERRIKNGWQVVEQH